MIRKLKHHTLYILTGHKYLLLFLPFLFINSCILFSIDQEKNIAKAIINNQTKDTLLYSSIHGGFVNTSGIKNNIILPNTQLLFFYFPIEENEDLIDQFFNECYYDSVWIYILDSRMREASVPGSWADTCSTLIYPDSQYLRRIWVRPAVIPKDDSLHDLFNYNSWIVNERNDSIEFTITDYDVNN